MAAVEPRPALWNVVLIFFAFFKRHGLEEQRMNVFITGINGYIGRNVAEALLNAGHAVCGVGKQDEPFDACVQYRKADITDDAAMKNVLEYFKPDTVIHLAAIVHASCKGQSEEAFMRINAVAPESIAKIVKGVGVKKFVFMSTIAVYGLKEGCITDVTPTSPNTLYGRSKLAAEQRLMKVWGSYVPEGCQGLGEHTAVTPALYILRCPMVYGKGCPGNYQRLRKIALKLPVVPKVSNARSLLFVGNLCKHIVALLERGECGGVYFVQDPEYVNTADMMAIIRKHNGKSTRYSGILGACLKVVMFLPPAKKAFRSLMIDHALSDKSAPKELLLFEECMEYTEGPVRH